MRPHWVDSEALRLRQPAAVRVQVNDDILGVRVTRELGRAEIKLSENINIVQIQ